MGRLRKKAEGLGDTVEQVLEVTGVAKVAKWLLGEDCGCEKRKEKLNKMFRYKTPLCLTQTEYEILTNDNLIQKDTLRPSEQMDIIKIYNRIFSENQVMTNCGSCMREVVNKMRLVYNEYKEDDANS